MVDAVGIHAHATKKLGLRPNNPTRPRVSISAFLKTAALPTFPTTDSTPALAYPMDHNDAAGDCVDAGGDHALELIYTQLTGAYTNWTDAFLLKAYQTQNPKFESWADAGGPNDNGMVIQEFLEWLVAQKLILAFGAVDQTNLDELKAATYIGLAIVTGETLQVAQQSEGKTWDYAAGSAVWGGHCTVASGYGADGNVQLISWGDIYEMTPAFIQHQVSEAWFVLTQAHIDHANFRDNFDIAGFSAAVTELTNGKVVVPVPAPTPPVPTPPVPPTPTPTPTPPANDVDAQLVAAADAWEKTIWSKFSKAGKLKIALNMWKAHNDYS